MPQWTFPLSISLKSGNDYYKRTLHWRQRHRDSKKFEKDLWASACSLLPGRMARLRNAEKLRRVIITSGRSRLLDMDNLYSGSKPLVDAMKRLGFIKDDRPQWCDLEVRQEESDAPFTRVEVIEEEDVS